MCAHCEKPLELFGNPINCALYYAPLRNANGEITTPPKMVLMDYTMQQGQTVIPIAYCPFCGRSLYEENK